jgi:hypothetical protein
MSARFLLICLVLLAASPARAAADTAPNAVTDWAAIVQQAIHNPPAAPRSAGTSQILHTMVMLAVYDAVVAIEGGYQPYRAPIDAVPGANVRAAVASAAYRTAYARVGAAQRLYLDAQYAAYLSAIPDGDGKVAGIAVGEAAAGAILAARAGDSFDTVVPYACSSTPPPVGEFEPDTGCPTGPGSPQPADAKLGQIAPFTFMGPGRYRANAPGPFESNRYADEFAETRDYGRMDSAVRSLEQTDVAYFWSENPFVHWNRNLMRLAISQGLSLADTARFFAQVHTTVSDAIIAGFEAKYRYRAWRPRTAIAQANLDGNHRTDPDPTWQPLLKVNHPEFPSGHGFWSSALLGAVSAFFGTNDVTWTIVTSKAAVPMLVKDERTYTRLDVLMQEIGDARIWAGLHWREAIEAGEQIGRRVAEDVARHYFQRVH